MLTDAQQTQQMHAVGWYRTQWHNCLGKRNAKKKERESQGFMFQVRGLAICTLGKAIVEHCGIVLGLG
jgi:hypothetical protein